jgi:hypothetical protein
MEMHRKSLVRAHPPVDRVPAISEVSLSKLAVLGSRSLEEAGLYGIEIRLRPAGQRTPRFHETDKVMAFLETL